MSKQSGTVPVHASRAPDERAAERRFRHLAEAIPHIVWIARADGSIDYVNRRWSEYTGLSPEESLGLREEWTAVVHPEDRSKCLDQRNRMITNGECDEVECRFRRAEDGSYRWFLCRAEPIRDDQDQVIQWFGTCTDIDDRKRAEEALRQSDVEYRAIFENAAVGQVLLDAETGRFLRVNRKFCEITGYTEDELRGLTFTEITYGEDRERERASFERMVHGEIQEYSTEKRYVRKDGSIVWVSLCATPVRTEAGRVVRLANVVQDITDRKQAEEALRESEQRYRELAETLPQLVWTCQPDGYCDYLSRQFCAYTGLSETEQLGYGWSRSVHPDDLDRVMAGWRVAVRASQVFDNEYRLRGADGVYRWFKSRGVPIRGADGRVVRWFGTCTDIDTQKRAEHALKDASRRKDEFLAMLSHKLRYPLAAIGTAIPLVRRTGSKDQLAWGTDVIDRQVKKLAQLIDDLLDVARIAQGKIQLHKELLDLAAIVHCAAEVARPLVEERRHTLTIQLAPGPLPLEADPARLGQVLVNLLINAAKYTDPGGRIELSAERQSGAIVVRIRDNGVGIAPELLPGIFELFTQGEPEPSRTQSGLGIGLCVVRRLVEMHGGTVTASSAGPGQGAEFVVRLPAACAPDAPAPATPTPQPQPAQTGRRVLVVEDDIDTARCMARLLKLAGHQVQLAFDGPMALEAVHAHHPEVILLNIVLPGMDGYQVARQIRRDATLPPVHLIAVSGYGQGRDCLCAREANFDHHLLKPVDHDALLSLIASAPARSG
jgi:PAS domain S-box-containing protein